MYDRTSGHRNSGSTFDLQTTKGPLSLYSLVSDDVGSLSVLVVPTRSIVESRSGGCLTCDRTSVRCDSDSTFSSRPTIGPRICTRKYPMVWTPTPPSWWPLFRIHRVHKKWVTGSDGSDFHRRLWVTVPSSYRWRWDRNGFSISGIFSLLVFKTSVSYVTYLIFYVYFRSCYMS